MLRIHEADIFYPPDYDELLYIIWDGDQRPATAYHVAQVYNFIKHKANRVYLSQWDNGKLTLRWKYLSEIHHFAEGIRYGQFKLYSDGAMLPIVS